MSEICTCAGDWSNLTQPACFGEAGEFLHGMFATELKADGSANCVLGADVLNQAYWDAKFKNESMQDRWLIQENITKITPITEDDITDTSNPLKTIDLSKGKRGYTFSVITKEPNKLAKKYAELACQDLVFYAITDSGNVVGKCVGDDLCGRKIARLSTTVVPKSTQNSQAAELLITVEFEITELDEDVDYITPDSGVDLTLSKGLIDAEIEFVSAGINSTVFKLFTCVGAKNARVAVSGLTAAELEVYNETDSAVIVLSGAITEVEGTYTAPFNVAQDLTDVIRVQGITTTVQKQYDLKKVDDVTTVIA